MIDYLSDHAKVLLKEYYLQGEDDTPEKAFERASSTYAKCPKLAERISDAAKKGWFMYSSPILSNAGRGGLPISCYLSYVDDSIDGIVGHSNELRYMSVMGGGVGGHWGEVRSVSKKSPGPIPFIKTVDADMVAYKQGSTRKGSYAAYLDVSHPDIVEFVNMRTPTGGDPNRKAFNLHLGVNLSDDFMQAVYKGLNWDLIDPNSGKITDTVDARGLWQSIIETRFRTGEPYLFFIDTANRHLAKSLKDAGLRINGSNLCSEITLPTAEGRSAVCCLSSLNLEKFDEWCNTTLVSDLIEFLDDVITHFVDHAPKSLKKAILGADRERSLGLGAMGFHSYLQSKMIPFESAMASSINRRMFSLIREQAEEATIRLAKERGEYPDGRGSGRRNAHLLAIAPNANSSIILNTSPSIEPYKSNAYTHSTRAGSYLQLNQYLMGRLNAHAELLAVADKQAWLDDQVQSVILNEGSVQHLTYLTDQEKSVFKTAFEIDQMWIIEHASVRQQWVCQAQSVNLFFPAGSDVNYVNAVHLSAHKKGLKSLYYLRTSAGKTADKVSTKMDRKNLKDYLGEECVACQG